MSGVPRFFLSAALPILSLCAFAQTPASIPTRSILVNVLDRSGNAVRDLTKGNFQLKINKQPVGVIGTDYSLAPRRIVVLLDMSGSMSGRRDANNKWRIASEAVEDLLAQTPADVPIALLSFSDHVHDTFDFRESRSAISRWLRAGPTQRSSLRGRTALRDAIVEGLRMLQPFRPGDAVYAITDGGDNASHISMDKTKAALRDSGVRLFAFLFAEPMPPGEEVVGLDSLVEMAGDSGGFVFGIPARGVVGGFSFLPSWDAEYDYDARTREKIKLYTQALNIQVSGFYRVQIAAPVRHGKAGKVSLEIIDAAGKTRKDVSYTFQRAISPAAK